LFVTGGCGTAGHDAEPAPLIRRSPCSPPSGRLGSPTRVSGGRAGLFGVEPSALRPLAEPSTPRALT